MTNWVQLAIEPMRALHYSLTTTITLELLVFIGLPDVSYSQGSTEGIHRLNPDALP